MDAKDKGKDMVSGSTTSTSQAAASGDIHAGWLVMARDMAELRVTGEDARCVALLRGFKDLIREYKPASSSNGPRAAVGKDLLQRINKHVDFLLKFRPMGAAMGNATRFVKIQVGLLPQDAL